MMYFVDKIILSAKRFNNEMNLLLLIIDNFRDNFFLMIKILTFVDEIFLWEKNLEIEIFISSRKFFSDEMKFSLGYF